MDKWDIELKKHKFILICYDHYNPLGIIRSLGEKGVEPIVILVTNGDKPRILHLSRYISKCHLVTTVAEGLELLTKEYSNEDCKPFVYSSSDDVASIVDLNYERLIDKFYFFHGHRQGIVTEHLNKKALNDLAIKHGCNVLKNEKVKRGVLPQNLRYPVITKAISPTLYAWKGDMHICYSETELIEAFKTIRSEEVLVQEFIEKKNELCIDGFAYNDGKNVEMPYYTNYLRFTGLSYGGSMVLRPFDKNNDVYTKVSAMLEEIGFTGIFEVEFLLDKNDTPYFLEINLRNSTWSYAYTYGGYNMPYLWAKGTLSGLLDLSAIEPKNEIYALSEMDDFQQEIVEHKKSFIPWFRDILKYDCYYYWNSKDLKPSLRYWIPLFLRNLFK